AWPTAPTCTPTARPTSRPMRTTPLFCTAWMRGESSRAGASPPEAPAREKSPKETSMHRICLVLLLCLPGVPALAQEPPLQAGFGQADLTPTLGDRSVYMAGFGHNRKATGVHDPLLARAIVLKHEKQKIALVSVDLVGLFHDRVQRVRRD